MNSTQINSDFELRFDLMRRLLVANWLRPESALGYAHLLCGVSRLLGRDWTQPSLEFGCTDGVNTAVLLGAEFDESFDVYEDAQWDRSAHTRSTLKDDYFDVVRRPDFQVPFRKKPAATIHYGVDWKEAHLSKCKRLGIFQNLLQIDAARPTLPLEDQTIETIWAPGLYWMDHLEQVLSELFRVLAPTGRLVTIVPDRAQLDFMLHQHIHTADASWIRDLDQGRYENTSRQARTETEWVELFQKMGFLVTAHERSFPDVVFKTYEVGLRPMFPVFMNMYEKLKSLTPEGWLDVKRHWIEAMEYFLKPLCDTTTMSDRPQCWHVFQLSKEP